MSFDPQRLVRLMPGAIAAAVAAGRQIMTIYQSNFAVTLKDDRSPLTEADLASQRTLTAELGRLAGEIPLLGEESSLSVIAARREWRTLWLVDPLDGTREFVKRNDEFTVNIALVHEQQALLGVLHAPAPGITYAAARGHGAWYYEASGRRRLIRTQAQASTPPRVLGSRSHRDSAVERIRQNLAEFQLTELGSALKFGVLAEGNADLYARLAPTYEWDTAAGQAIVEEAGGRVVGLDGAPLRYNARDTLTNPSFVAWADNSRDWLSLLQAG